MWTKSDILQLLQLLTMVIFATVHAAWCLLVHQGEAFLIQCISVLTSLTVNMRRYATLARPIEKECDVAATAVEMPNAVKETDVPV